MHVDERTLDLFAPFDREMGNPIRTRIKTQKQFEEFVMLNSGVSTDVFTSVYPSNHIVDKLFFDFDCNPKKHEGLTMAEVWSDFCKFYEYQVSIGEHPLPIVTGKKGYHNQMPLIPEKVSKIELWTATMSLLYDSGMVSFKLDDNGIKKWNISRAIDTTSIGDIERLCRVPNTPRLPDKAHWCTWLPLYPDDIRDMSVEDTFKWAERYHIRDDACVRTRSIRSFLTHDFDFFVGFSSGKAFTTFSEIDPLDEREKFLYSMLRPFMSDSIIANVINPEADHEYRFVTALAMLEAGLDVGFVVSLLKQIGWRDFSESYTRYQVEQISKNRGIKYQFKPQFGAALLCGKRAPSADKDFPVQSSPTQE